MTEATWSKGLEGVIAAESKICDIDGEKGLLSYRGYTIQDLATNSTFGETAFLLLYGKLPSRAELQAFEDKLKSYRALDASIINVLKGLRPDTHPMIALQTAVAAHGSINPLAAGYNEANFERSLQLIARFPTMVAAFERIKAGKEPIAPRADLGHGQNFLYMLLGEAPDEETGHIFDVCLILHMEHSFNASTFTGRVVAATLAPIDASVSAAVGALYGPLHGGANEATLDMLDEMATVADAEPWIRNALASKKKVMGMGHRVYKAKDPRSFILEGHLARVSEKTGKTGDYQKLKIVENYMRAEMERAGKRIYPNVDFFSGALYRLLGIPTEIFTCIFGIARVAGWTAHIMEQWSDNRIYRPDCAYIGDHDLQWAPFEKR